LSASTVVGPNSYVRPTASSRNAGPPEAAAASVSAKTSEDDGCLLILVLTDSTWLDEVEKYPFRPSRILQAIADGIELS
jgi:hypothetical protein